MKCHAQIGNNNTTSSYIENAGCLAVEDLESLCRHSSSMQRCIFMKVQLAGIDELRLWCGTCSWVNLCSTDTFSLCWCDVVANISATLSLCGSLAESKQNGWLQEEICLTGLLR